MHKSFNFKIVLIIAISTICVFIKLHAQSKDTLCYVFFGHTYDWTSVINRVDQRIEAIDMSRFDRIWLGGDICSEASLKYNTLAYIDSVFDLGKPENHWALGNHDTRNGNIEWIEEFTKRPTYYAYSKDGITTIVINGNISPLDCEKLNKQYEIIENVCDTISSGYLILIAHHGIFSDIPGILNPNLFGHSCLKNWMANCYDDSASYVNSIYPMLVEVEKKGVEVMHIMGDVGGGALKSYHGISDDGVEFFGSGINNSYNISRGIPITSPDLVLVFKHILSSKKLTWEFVELNDL